MRQEVGGLVQQVDAQLVILDADMHMHAADQQPPRDPLQVRRRARCSAPCRCAAGSAIGEGMRGGGDRGEAERAAMRADGGAQPGKFVARFL